MKVMYLSRGLGISVLALQGWKASPERLPFLKEQLALAAKRLYGTYLQETLLSARQYVKYVKYVKYNALLSAQLTLQRSAVLDSQPFCNTSEAAMPLLHMHQEVTLLFTKRASKR